MGALFIYLLTSPWETISAELFQAHGVFHVSYILSLNFQNVLILK